MRRKPQRGVMARWGMRKSPGEDEVSIVRDTIIHGEYRRLEYTLAGARLPGSEHIGARR